MIFKKWRIYGLRPRMKDRQQGSEGGKTCYNNIFGYTLMAHILGLLVGGSLVLAMVVPSCGRLALYTASIALFHMLEFLLTARYHATTVTFDCKEPPLPPLLLSPTATFNQRLRQPSCSTTARHTRCPSWRPS